MKNIGIITQGALPLPAVKGGAVEALIQMVLDKNEKNPSFNFFVFSPANNCAIEKVHSYKYAAFLFIETGSIFYKIMRGGRYVINRYFGKYIGNQYISKVISTMRDGKLALDLIILENAPEYVIPLKKKFNIPIIQHIHNDYFNDKSKRNEQIIVGTNLFLAVSNYIRNNIKRWDDDIRVETLYNGVDVKLFGTPVPDIEKERLKKQLNFTSTDKIILFSGRIQPNKGVKELVQAFNLISEKCNAKLLIIGASVFSGNNKTKYIREIQDLINVQKRNVIFTGYIDYSLVHLYNQIADVIVLPSLWEEPFALSCLEALATGKPTIVTRSGGLPEAIGDNGGIVIEKDVYLIENLRANIEKVLLDSTLQQNLSQGAFERSRYFTTDIFWNNFRNILLNYLN